VKGQQFITPKGVTLNSPTTPKNLIYTVLILVGVSLEDYYGCDKLEPINQIQFANTEADARAKMMIYLLERRLIENA
jgi:hypothetical protein